LRERTFAIHVSRGVHDAALHGDVREPCLKRLLKPAGPIHHDQLGRSEAASLQVLEQQGPLGLGLRGPEPVGEQSLGAVGGDREGREHLAVGDPQLGPDLVVLPVQEQVAHLRWNGSLVDRPLLVLEDLGRSGHRRAGDLLAHSSAETRSKFLPETPARNSCPISRSSS